MEHHKILKQLTENTRNAVNNTARHLAPAFLGFALIPSVPQIVLTAVGSALLGGGVGYAIDRRIQTNMETAYAISGLTLLAGFLGTMTMAVATGIPPAITSPIASASVGIASGMIFGADRRNRANRH